MMQTVVLLLLISCAVNGAQDNLNEAKPAQCCDGSVSMAVGALTEKVANLMDKLTQVETKLDQTETELTQLKSITLGTPKVAFSASLYETGSGNTGPFNTATPLKYKNVFSNFGSNYNPATGIFTAPTKGMYFFRFSMFNNLEEHSNSIVSLTKNGQRVVSVSDTSRSDNRDMGSNAAVFPLEAGDNVYVELAANRLVYDDTMNYNTFTGFLLFTL
ncbi:complement C1q-like protein 2 isoform X1 [Periophthalmus magnuspinnatus]|uniref:complement C1q-like protein 2 isoform X1 n=1 Tax=Periophthalmus magnuspinnatus TaxID=409849 RepID=UPI0024372410|nr:complement C1q-like protein 2 isoform X1 [Periophthalmus magnuspinnatus]